MGQVQEVRATLISDSLSDGLCSAGPIVEQGTHFCDLSRYFGGDVDMSTVQAHSLEWDENAGHLSKMVVDETAIPPENRIPRVTSATWCVPLTSAGPAHTKLTGLCFAGSTRAVL